MLPIIGQMLSDQLPKAAGSVPIWTRRAQIKKWPLSRALKCGIELAEALNYCRAPHARAPIAPARTPTLRHDGPPHRRPALATPFATPSSCLRLTLA